MKKDETPSEPMLRKKMPAEVFVKIWESGGKKQFIGGIWQDFVVIRKHSSGSFQIEFSDIEIEGWIQIEKTKTPLLHLALVNCQLPDFDFVNGNAQSIVIKQNSIIGTFKMQYSKLESFSIENSIAGTYLISDSTTGNFSIANSKIGDFFIKNSTTGGFLIENKSLLRNFSISQNSSLDSFHIRDSQIGDFSIFNSTSADFWILQNSKTGHFSINDNSTTGSFFINNSVIGNFGVRENSSIDRFSISENSTSGDFKILNSRATILSIKENSRLSKVNVWHSTLQKIEVRSNSFISHFKCQFNFQGPVHLTLKQSSFGHLNLNNSVFPEFTTLIISDCSINRLTLNNFCNYGTVFFNRLSPLDEYEDFKKNENDTPIFVEGNLQFNMSQYASTLRLTDSDLGKIQFINCNLRQFKRFEFSNTKMLDVFVAGSRMPENKAFCLPDNEQNLWQIAEQKRLAYGQFKKIYEARGDIAGSLRYLAYEMEAYRELLHYRIKRHRLFSKQWFDYFGELGILWFNQISTNFGNNWVRGVLVTFLATGICFSIYCFSVGYRPGADVDKFLELTSYAPGYLNPFRDDDLIIQTMQIDGMKIYWYSRLWDYLSRIIVAYFVYQTIQAFRKLGKSSG